MLKNEAGLLKTKDCVVGVIDDDPVNSAMLEAMLARAGYTGLTFASAADFRRRSGADSVDMILLDWDMPGESGIAFLRSMREQERMTTPVIFVTHYDRDEQIVQGLNAGADDYVTKPVDAKILIARIESVLRRLNRKGGDVESWPPFEFDITERALRIEGRPRHATNREFELMLFMFRRHGRVVTRESLLTHVWRLNGNVETRSIDTHVSRLRKLFGLDGSSGWRLEGVYQKGYCLKRVAESVDIDR